MASLLEPFEVLQLERSTRLQAIALWKASQAAYRVKLNLSGEEANLTTSSFADSDASRAVRSHELFDPAGKDAGDHASLFGRFRCGESPGGS
jgi:hypothetical protein